MAARSIPFSVLDLSFVREGETPREALHDTLTLAQHVEKLGYHRFWLAEHHNMAGIASAATSVAIGYVAGGTSTIRVGSGGIMLPNHSPLVIAEQFGTLATLYPDRIDLGLGRAPGTDRPTSQALRRDTTSSPDNFPHDVQELQAYFAPSTPGQVVRAIPGDGLEVPLYLLGSSTFNAQLAALLGLPFAFASHFAPAMLFDALAIYRQDFGPSKVLDKPYAMVAANVVVANTDKEAQRLFTSSQLGVLEFQRGKRPKLMPPVDSMDGLWSPAEEAGVESFLRYAFVGSPSTVATGLSNFLNETGADELIITTRVYDMDARLRSFELLAEVREKIGSVLVK
jgi:luciferase family oxidoreductase group 1